MADSKNQNVRFDEVQHAFGSHVRTLMPSSVSSGFVAGEFYHLNKSPDLMQPVAVSDGNSCAIERNGQTVSFDNQIIIGKAKVYLNANQVPFIEFGDERNTAQTQGRPVAIREKREPKLSWSQTAINTYIVSKAAGVNSPESMDTIKTAFKDLGLSCVNANSGEQTTPLLTMSDARKIFDAAIGPRVNR